MTLDAASPSARIFLREIVGGVTTMMCRWSAACIGEVRSSIVVIRDVARPFTSLDTVVSQPSTRISFNGKLDNRMKVYQRLAAQISSPRDYLIANDILELGMIAALRPPNPVTFFLHGDYDYYYELAMRHADQIGSFGCVSAAIKEKFQSMLPTRATDMYLTYPIVPEPSDDRPSRNPNSPIRLLFVGRLTEEKGFYDLPLIDAVLTEKGVTATWTVVGEAPLPLNDAHRLWLRRSNVRYISHVHFNRMEAVYSDNDILVFPSRFEGFGMCIAEGMKCGTVPIASRLQAGIPEMIDDGVTGFIVDAGDVATFAQRIEELVRRPEKLFEFGERASRAARKRFDSKVAVKSMTNAILSADVSMGPSGPTYLSRMDIGILPNVVVRTGRSVFNKLRET